jgi:hypothetical protein
MPERPTRRYRPRGSRFDIAYVWPGGASMRWQSRPDRTLDQLTIDR